MLIDARDLETGTRLNGDVCIVGGGPAGLTLANRLRGSGRKIILLERGGLPGRPLGVGESETTADASSDFDAPPGVPPRLGGGANEWIVRLPWMVRGVRMLPLSPTDLERRSWVPYSGWPLTWDELAPYWRRAHDELDLGPRGYDTAEWSEAGRRPFDLEDFGFSTAMERFPRSSVFTKRIWNQLRSASDVDVVIHAPVGALEGDADHVERLEIDCGSRGRLTATANTFVLASGGVVNPSLLLTARAGRGLPAGNAALGRYYTDHVRCYTGTFTPCDPAVFSRAGLYDFASTPNGVAMGKLVPTELLQRQHGLLNSAAMLIPKPSVRVSRSLQSVRGLAASLRTRRFPQPRPGLGDISTAAWHLARLAPEMSFRQRRFPPHVDAGWSSLTGVERRFSSFLVEHQVEQAPDPGNGLQLSGGFDSSGRLDTTLTWRWSDLDVASIESTQQLVGRAFAESGLGSFEPTRWEERPELTTPGGAFHPTGMTRMGASERSSVVDENAKVHGVDNLFVAGSSVFPTGGYANPTLTLLALTIRLADHLAAVR